MESVYESLVNYSKDNIYPMHMPGHKRNGSLFHMDNPYELDITEVDGFDNLHEPKELLLRAMERAAKLYRSERSYFLVNGSTCGILAGICGCTKKGDRIIMARNCHKSVYDAVFINELQPIYIYPPFQEEFHIDCGIPPEKIQEMLITYSDVKLVVITSPTYEGVLSDIKSIVEISHKNGVPVLVDEAHGAHFGFYKDLPITSISCGADLVIHSVHKTLPAFTQTALLHVNGSLVDYKKVERYLSIYQSSSPSYLLMAGMDKCMEILECQGQELFKRYYDNLCEFYKETEILKNITILKNEDCYYQKDPSKIVISVKGTDMSGSQLYQSLLNRYHIQLEMASLNYVIAMTSIGDSKEGFVRLRKAMLEIDQEINLLPDRSNENFQLEPTIIKYSSYAAFLKTGKIVPLNASMGKVAKNYVYAYPPGIPVLVPGEVISQSWISWIESYIGKKFEFKGLIYCQTPHIEVIDEKD